MADSSEVLNLARRLHREYVASRAGMADPVREGDCEICLVRARVLLTEEVAVSTGAEYDGAHGRPEA